MSNLTRGQILKDPEVIGTGSNSAKIRLYDNDESNYVDVQAAATISSNFTLTLPADDGDAGQFLQTNGSGALSWQDVSASAGGSQGQLQYNDNDNLEGAAGLTTDGTHLTINAAGELRFADTSGGEYVAFKAPGTVAANRTYTLPATIGSVGQVLKVASGRTDTAATLEWADDLQGAGTTPGGSDTFVQFNDGGAFGGDAGFTYNKSTDSATLAGTMTAGALVVDATTLDNNTITTSSGSLDLNPSTSVNFRANKPIRLYSSSDTDYVGIAAASTVSSTYTLTFPGAIGAADDVLAIDGTGNVSFINNTRTLNFVIENSGATITTGIKGYVVIDFNCQVTGWTVVGDGSASGAIVVDVWRTTYANFNPPTNPTATQSIAGTEKPTITSGQQKGQDTSITTWSSSTIKGVSTVGGIVAGDILAFNVDSVANFSRVTVALRLRML